MAIDKSEVHSRLTDEERSEVEGLEVWIDGNLMMDKRIIPLADYPPDGVVKELTRRYGKCGWNIKFYNDQNGPRIEFD